jgi:hypothetical protein
MRSRQHSQFHRLNISTDGSWRIGIFLVSYLNEKMANKAPEPTPGACHASCDRMSASRNETNWNPFPSEAAHGAPSSRRGSSLTFGKRCTFDHEHSKFHSSGFKAETVALRQSGRRCCGDCFDSRRSWRRDSFAPRQFGRFPCDEVAGYRCRDSLLAVCSYREGDRYCSIVVHSMNQKKAEQGARANAGSCHAACDGRCFEMKFPK